jgi:hypothetical protein
MKSWQYEIGDVLRINHNEQEVLARVAGYMDSLDDTTPLLVNLRVAGGLRWGGRQVKVQPEQIIEALPDWYQEQHTQWEAEIATYANEQWAKMTDAQKRLVHEQAVKLGLGRERRSPLDILIDRAVGRE